MEAGLQASRLRPSSTLTAVFHDEGYGHRELIIYDGSTAILAVALTGREATNLALEMLKSGTADLWK